MINRRWVQFISWTGLLGLSLLVWSRPVRADDVSNRFGVSGFLGAAFPTGPEDVTSVTNTSGLNLGGMVSMQLSPGFGVGFSYEHMEFGNGKQASPINLMLLLRFMPESRWTPTIQAGGGSVGSLDTNKVQTLGCKAGVGLDYFVTPSIAVGPQVNYYYLSHSGGATNTYANVVGVNAAVTYYFGSTVGGN